MLALREARPGDAALILAYIRELAEFEKLTHECVADEALIRAHLFGPKPRAHAVMAEWNGAAAGFALYFHTFSTFLARPGLYVEDVFVRPAFREKGIASALFRHLARTAIAEGCGRLEWSVLDWNETAIRFYRSIGAVALDGWTVQRVSGEALARLAGAD